MASLLSDGWKSASIWLRMNDGFASANAGPVKVSILTIRSRLVTVTLLVFRRSVQADVVSFAGNAVAAGIAHGDQRRRARRVGVLIIHFRRDVVAELFLFDERIVRQQWLAGTAFVVGQFAVDVDCRVRIKSAQTLFVARLVADASVGQAVDLRALSLAWRGGRCWRLSAVLFVDSGMVTLAGCSSVRVGGFR